MIGNRKIKAGALQLVLFVGALIAVLLFAFILLTHTHYLFEKKTDLTIALLQEANRGLELSFDKEMMVGNTLEIPLENDWGIDCTIQKEFWGILELRKVTTSKGKSKFEKWAWVGKVDAKKPGLYLANHQRPLVLAGEAKITGKVFLPERGMRMGNIGGNGYHYDQLIYGEQRHSQKELPRISDPIKSGIETWAFLQTRPSGDKVRLKKGMEIKNGFSTRTKIIEGDVLHFQDETLVGNIVIWANSKIIVENTSDLRDVILIAPKIIIKSGFTGNFQAFANEQIYLEKECQLIYPSVLAVKPRYISNENHHLKPFIELDKSVKFSGIIAYMDDEKMNNYIPHIRIGENTGILGEVYSTQNVEHRGQVVGCITANGFVTHENGNIYQNHLYDGTIDGTLLPPEYVGMLYATEKPNGVLKWLY